MEPAWTVSDEARQRYLLLFRRFLDGDTPPQDFVTTFLDMWRNDRDRVVTTSEVVDVVMTSVDCYEPEPDPASPSQISEEQLRADVAAAVERLAAERE